MTDRDEIADLADRMGAMFEFEFEVEWGSFTTAEQDELLALLAQRIAHGEERLEALTENVRVLGLLFAYQEGALTALELVERVVARCPDPLAPPE